MPDWERRLERWVRQACIAEVTAVKPGNVSPEHAFADATVEDFCRSADAIAPVIAKAEQQGVGQTILTAVEATRFAVGHNTNLGIILLLTPLACVPEQLSIDAGIEQVLSALTVDDAELTYEAITRASPGGLGTAETEDVNQRPTMDLRACMSLAADRDLVAAQYANGFRQILNVGLPLLTQTRHWQQHTEHRLAWVAVNLLAEFGDSLIRRKCGDALNQTVQNMARRVLESGWPHHSGSDHCYEELDRFLRADGNRRNPGTTADMIAAILFIDLRRTQGGDLTHERSP
ncbi:MAG: triphosphoribosyl-dephospho-CoA synthase [Fuerstiella sp.]